MKSSYFKDKMAEMRGLEPPTFWLTASCSAIELHLNKLAGIEGIEPSLTESKSVVLPLDHIPISGGECEI